MTGVVVALLWVGLSGCLGLHITPCGDDQKQQVEETGDAVFVCTDIRTAEVRWRVTYTNQPDLVLGTCNSVDKCNVRADNVSIIRPVSDTSLLIVTEDHRRLAGTLECAELNGGQFAGSATCQLHVVYTSYNVTCTTTVNNTDWTVRGTCHVDKIYNSDGDYTCQWQQQPSLGSTIPGHQSLVPFTDSTGQQYQRMTCSFTTPMPTADGPHDFVLTVDPRNRPGDTHRGQSVDIQSPKGPPVLHNCPSDVVEGDDVTCTCQASASKPPALVTWNDVNTTATLQLTSVQKSQTYRHTCSQFWGGLDAAHVLTTKYTVNVKYPPSSPPVITGVTSYSAGDTLSLTCTVTGGNPPVTSVTFYCGDHGDGDDVTSVTEGQTSVTIVVLISTLYNKDNGSVCLCSGLWRDRPNLYADTSSVTISVHGSGESIQSKEDEIRELKATAGVVGGVALVIFIALVIVIIVVVKRRCDPLYAKPSVRRGQDAEHTYTDLDNYQHINPNAPPVCSPRQQQHVNTPSAARPQQTLSEEVQYEIPATERSPVGQYEIPATERSPVGQYEIPATERSPVGQYEIPATERSPVGQYEIPATERSPVGQYEISATERSPVGQYKNTIGVRQPASSGHEYENQ